MDDEKTTIWAQFRGIDPNAAEVEINVRQSVFVFEDLFIEVNHGPYVVDNNVLLSRRTLYDNSQGGGLSP